MIYIDVKDKNDGYKLVEINVNGDKFYMGFYNNLDLYWFYYPPEGILNSPSMKTFVITQENSTLYGYINTLFQNVVENTPFSFKSDIHPIISPLETGLINKNIITWYSDDAEIDYASRFEIIKNDNFFKIIFYKGKLENNFQTYCVRLRNSGSRYEPFNSLFMDLYHKLIEYDNQVTFDDLFFMEDESRKRTNNKNIT